MWVNEHASSTQIWVGEKAHVKDVVTRFGKEGYRLCVVTSLELVERCKCGV